MADKFKKVDKEYVLSDSSVNCYGFRLLTSGYQLDGFSKNPIGFHMHNRPGGVILKWEDLRVDGDKVLGKPVINLSNPRGQQTLDEAEGGFLNAASMGEFVVLDYSLEPDMMLPNQTGPTVTSWYNRECSLVDIPGNSNALCALFDKDGNAMKLADLMAGLTSSLSTQNEIQKLNFNMKQITLSINAGLFASLYACMGLAATAKPEDIAAALPDLIGKAERVDQLEIDKVNLSKELTAEKLKLTNLQKDTVGKEVTTMLDGALEAKKVTVEVRNQLAKDYANNPTGLKVLLEGMGAYTGVVNQLAAATKEVPKEYAGKDWDTLRQEGLLPQLKADHLELYKKVWEKEHGEKYPS